MSTMLVTILRLRSRTAAMLMRTFSLLMPNSMLREKNEATLALWMMFLLGRHAMFGHEPPTHLRSTTTARCPFCAKAPARTLPPAPPPSTTRSYSSGEVDVFIDMALFLLSCEEPYRNDLRPARTSSERSC